MNSLLPLSLKTLFHCHYHANSHLEIIVTLQQFPSPCHAHLLQMTPSKSVAYVAMLNLLKNLWKNKSELEAEET